MSRYRFIAAERGHYPVRQLCQVLGVPPSSFYAWQQGQQQAAESELPAWEKALVKVFSRHKRRYGTRRLQVALGQKGHRWAASACARPCAGGACTRFSPRPSPRARPTLPTACAAPPTDCSTSPSRLRPTGSGSRTSPYLPLANGAWAYLCAFQDMASKHVMATMPEELATMALQRGFLAQPPTPGLLVHSDRCGQYCGNAYRVLLHRYGAVRLQSRRGECYDNAQAESLWSRPKTEVLELREWPVFADLADAQASVADYFDYYNHDRLHSSISYQTPYSTHHQLLQTTALNCPA
ncbi:IS3 family transposase [Hymenobacter sp.]|uniref:IS3 family transposase n=1 Tax=Hymenobacter sp. TaxID=1898978 RepID=UPI00286D58D3|nr:IS3 family transposase [Hymenobacter sp.]